ncbi:MAG TPA: aminodeoxychorismate/anthranilate synthase component II [Bacteroidia bacterium]
MKILVLDNYDSFTYNLVHYLEKESDAVIEVHRNDMISIEEIQPFDKLLLSPGPGTPSEAGILKEVIKKYGSSKSILGICLGQQAIAEVFGGSLHNLENVYHGISTRINIINDDPLFKGLPRSFSVGRYHSWVVNREGFPAELEISAVDEEGYVMALRHRTLDIRGVQFHPESILSEYGSEIINNWISG